MKIPHYYLLDYLTQYDGDRSQGHWNATKMVSAIKGRQFKGYARLKLADGQTKNYDSESANALATVVLNTLGQSKLPGAVTQPSLLVPIPNHDMTLVSGDDHKIIKTAQAVLNAYNRAENKPHNVTLWTGLRWKEVRPEAKSTSGRRSPDVYDGKFGLKSQPTEIPVILFDDVYTSGSQAKAAAKYLADQGVDVTAVVTVAKTTHEPSANAFEWRQGECEIEDDSTWDF